jgi:hypothetical protein
MDEKSLKHYIGEISCLLKDYARQAKVGADHPTLSSSKGKALGDDEA